MSKKNIKKAFRRIADAIINDQAKHGYKVLLFPMDGALPYAKGLLDSLREKGVSIIWTTIKATSYTGTTSGVMKIQELPEKFNFINATVYVADDIIESAKTSIALYELLRKRGAAEVKFTPLVNKVVENRLTIHGQEIEILKAGFELSSENPPFIIGAGFDYDGYCRNFKNIHDALPELRPTEEENKILSREPTLRKEWLELHAKQRDYAARVLQRAAKPDGFFGAKLKKAPDTNALANNVVTDDTSASLAP